MSLTDKTPKQSLHNVCFIRTDKLYGDHVHYKCNHPLSMIMPPEYLPSNVVKVT